MSNSLDKLDTVEIKVTIKPEQIKVAENLLELKQDESEKRKIYFCEDIQTFCTPKKLQLFEHGIILRLRKNQDNPDDSTVKLRPVSSQISDQWRRIEGFKIEGDWVGDRKIESASFTTEQNQGEIEETVERKRSLDKLFSEQQEHFLKTSAEIEVHLNNLQVLGPVKAFRWKPKLGGSLTYPIRCERWDIPDGRQFLELSIRVQPEQAQVAQEQFMQYLKLKHNKLDLTGVQETKTRLVLEYFANELQG
ncbi:hypothetical protein [Nostoc sp. ChiQUE01b]|uniref:hypothetical protein n=1 Tax=Nostoc sp. ChiQUE01b TaxID=3075376 RepID=UPI002AD37DE1|nr:hypothetical protein [Nostoc sp. ChiQUE01b]MDZ8264011.1 hypothetical protein [Nostoc sp. ChiQUE01b]